MTDIAEILTVRNLLKARKLLKPTLLLRRAYRSPNPYLAVPAAVLLVLGALRRFSDSRSSTTKRVRLRPGQSFIVTARTRDGVKRSSD